MEYWKLPPRVKVLEALGAIADNRVKMINEYEAYVSSSLGDRVYRVRWDGDRGIASDDNGSVYRGYLGYPSIAFLMLKGVLPYDEEIARAIKGIKWREVNERFKRYLLVEEYVKEVAEKRGISKDKVGKFVESVIKEIREKRFYKIKP